MVKPDGPKGLLGGSKGSGSWPGNGWSVRDPVRGARVQEDLCDGVGGSGGVHEWSPMVG